MDGPAHVLRERARPGSTSVTSAYSNYGAGLTGQILASVTGQSWGDDVQSNILDRLGMGHTTPFEPVPPALAADAAHSYVWTDAGYREIPFIFDRLPPDGAISSTAADMADFMIAHLNGGNPIADNCFHPSRHRSTGPGHARADARAVVQSPTPTWTDTPTDSGSAPLPGTAH